MGIEINNGNIKVFTAISYHFPFSYPKPQVDSQNMATLNILQIFSVLAGYNIAQFPRSHAPDCTAYYSHGDKWTWHKVTTELVRKDHRLGQIQNFNNYSTEMPDQPMRLMFTQSVVKLGGSNFAAVSLFGALTPSREKNK